MPSDESGARSRQLEQRLDAIEDNIEWLRENGFDDEESLKRVALVLGDAEAMKRIMTNGTIAEVEANDE